MLVELLLLNHVRRVKLNLILLILLIHFLALGGLLRIKVDWWHLEVSLKLLLMRLLLLVVLFVDLFVNWVTDHALLELKVDLIVFYWLLLLLLLLSFHLLYHKFLESVMILLLFELNIHHFINFLLKFLNNLTQELIKSTLILFSIQKSLFRWIWFHYFSFSKILGYSMIRNL